MGIKNHARKIADRIAHGVFAFNRKLPTYYFGYWLWMEKKAGIRYILDMKAVLLKLYSLI
jgi:hypothetical protein